MSDDLDEVTRTCERCDFPILAPETTPCPYCYGTNVWSAAQLQAMLYGVPVMRLLRLRLALRSPDGATRRAAEEAISPRLAEWIARNDTENAATPTSILATVVDVLLALHAISEEHATPDQLTDVIDGVLTGQLDRLPLAPRGPCFCDSGRRYRWCHGRRG